jgi:hypothetical protein
MNTDAMMTVSLTFTKNLGNYESIKITAGLEVPTDNTDFDTKYKMLYSLIERVILKESEGVGAKLRGETFNSDGGR